MLLVIGGGLVTTAFTTILVIFIWLIAGWGWGVSMLVIFGTAVIVLCAEAHKKSKEDDLLREYQLQRARRALGK